MDEIPFPDFVIDSSEFLKSVKGSFTCYCLSFNLKVQPNFCGTCANPDTYQIQSWPTSVLQNPCGECVACIASLSKVIVTCSVHVLR